MPAEKTMLAATQSNNLASFESYQDHINGQRVDTRSAAWRFIRATYPDYHVTQAKQTNTDLFSFASAGLASYTLDDENEAFIMTRKWHSVGEGVEKQVNPGKLSDDHTFARFQYVWEEHSFIVIYVVYEDPFMGRKELCYILHPRSESDVDGHCAATDALLLAVGKWTSQLHEEIFVFDDGYWEKSRELWKSVKDASWDDVILNPEMKKNIIDDVQSFFDNRAIYKQFAVPWKRGIILHGQPGNGKTASTRAIMNSLYKRTDPIPSLYVKSLETKCNTEQHAIGQIFAQARKSAPCLLVFEDLDSLVGDNVRSYFLNEVDGLESNDGILMIGSTNHLNKLDASIAKRPSRFDRKYKFNLPGEEERRLYAAYWRKKLLENETVEFPEEITDIVAKLTEGFSFAYLKELFVMALMSLVRGFKGDDFEFVDAEEAASAEGSEDEKALAEAKKKVEEEEKNVCTCVAKCSTCDKPLPAKSAKKQKAGEEGSEGANEEGEASSIKKDKDTENLEKMSMPVVEIPAHLSDNLLIKVIKYQIRVLHVEMDNSKDSEENGQNKDGPCTTAAVRQAAMFRRLRRRLEKQN